MALRAPTLMPIGDSALVVRFADRLEMDANSATIAAAQHISAAAPVGVLEIVPSLVSTLVRYDPRKIAYETLAGEIRLMLSVEHPPLPEPAHHTIEVRFGGEGGPDLEEVAEKLEMAPEAFIAAHNATPLRVLAGGFAPGFVYCGLHEAALHLPRRQEVRGSVPAGSILFAAGQTAITSTPIPTGWYVIGQTDFRNFDPAREPATLLRPGDMVQFAGGRS